VKGILGTRKTLLIFAMTLYMITTANSGNMKTETAANDIKANKILKPSVELAGYSITKLWEGRIDERQGAYLRAHNKDKVIDIIIIVKDDLPEYVKRIEYYDRSADENLDFVKMKIYEKGKDWREVAITEENKYGLKFANNNYRKLLQKIRTLQKGEIKK
jgi:hypothetical protein